MKVGGKIVSTAKLHIEKKVYQSVGHIEDVVTDKDHRRLGYGKLLIKHVSYIALNSGCHKAVLSAEFRNTAFYKSCKFEPTGMSFVLRNMKSIINDTD